MSKELQSSSPDNETQFIEALRKFWYATVCCLIEVREDGESLFHLSKMRKICIKVNYVEESIIL